MGELIFALFIGGWMIGLGVLIIVYMGRECKRVIKK